MMSDKDTEHDKIHSSRITYIPLRETLIKAGVLQPRSANIPKKSLQGDTNIKSEDPTSPEPYLKKRKTEFLNGYQSLPLTGYPSDKPRQALPAGLSALPLGSTESPKSLAPQLPYYRVPFGKKVPTDVRLLSTKMIPRAPIPSFTPLQRISSRFVSSVDLESSELFDVPPPRSTRWNVQGVYDVTSVVDGYVDTAGFSLRLFYYNLGDQSQLFAKFAFDKLEGMMRLCPYEAVSTSGVKLELEEFEKACDLPRQMEPSPLRRSWWMRWRAKDGGMRLGELVGGLPDLNYEFSFEEEEGSASKDNIGLRILFVMVYNENHFVFRGKKVANLEDETAPSRWEQRALWNSLWNWEWDPVPDSWSDSSSDSDEDFVARLRRGGSSIRENKSKIKRTIKTKIPTGPSGLSSASTPINKHIELPPLGAFDVTGIWQIEAQHLRSHLGISDKDGNRGCMYITVKMANNPRHHKIGRQLWADFRLGPRVCGVMRFCPRPNSEEEQRITLPLKEFEKACVLESACWPGPSPEGKGEWYMRWRGVYKSREISRDQADYRVSFKKDDDGKVKMRGVIELDSLMFPWTAERLFAAMPPARNEPSVTKTWSEARPEHDRILSRSEWFTGLV